jgi:hypothetical protein
MNSTRLLKVASWFFLTLVGAPSVFSFLGGMSLATVQLLAFVGTIGWFLATPFWMGRQGQIDASNNASH